MHGDRGSFFFFGVHRLYLGASLMYFFLFGSWCIYFLWVVYVRGRHYVIFYVSFIVSCFTCVTLIIDLYYEVIYGICLLFSVFCFVKSRIFFCFTCIFHTCVYMFVECFRNLQVYSVMLLSTLATDRY